VSVHADWIQDAAIERNRRLRQARQARAAAARRTNSSSAFSVRVLLAQLASIVRAGQSWFVVVLVGECCTFHSYIPAAGSPSCARFLILPSTHLALPGVCIGANAAVISLVTEWLSDLKMGYCADGWWLNQGFCCWELDGDNELGCSQWHPWSEYAVARWVIYVAFAVSPFISSSLYPAVGGGPRRC
jgi:chloride channel 3/4/5